MLDCMSGTSADGIGTIQLGATPLRLPEPAGAPPRYLRFR